MQWQRQRGIQVEAPDQGRSPETRFAARKALDVKIECAVERRLPQLLVHAGGLDTRGVIDGDHVSNICALEVLITPGMGIQKNAAGGIREERVRFHLRVDDLRKDITEGDAKDVTAQVVDVGNRARIVAKCSFSVETNFRTALAYAVDPTIENAEKSQICKRVFGRAHAELAVWRPAALRKILGTG